MSGNIDPKELKLLGDILALVVNDQPGQSASALDMLRRRAQQDNVTGGAIRQIFDQLRSEVSRREAAPTSSLTDADSFLSTDPELDRQREILRQLRQQYALLETELAEAQRTSHAARLALKKMRRTGMFLIPLLVMASAGGVFWMMKQAPKPSDGYSIHVDPSARPLPAQRLLDNPLPPGALPLPTDMAALPDTVLREIAEHFRGCGLVTPAALEAYGHAVHAEIEIDANGIIHVARLTPADGGDAKDPAFQAVAGPIGRRLVATSCAALPLPAYLHAQVKTISFLLQP